MRPMTMGHLPWRVVLLALVAVTTAWAGESPAQVDSAVRQRCFAILLEGLRSDQFWPSMHAAEALTQAGRGARVLEALKGRLATETDDQHRCGLAREQVRAGERGPAAVMLSILADKQSKGRIHAAESLYKVREVGDGKLLRAALDEGDPVLEMMAAAALFRGGDKAALARVRRHLSNADATKARIAAWIVGRLGDRSDWPALRRLEAVEMAPLAQSFVINALAQLRAPGALKRVEANLRHADAGVRTYAVQTVGDCHAVSLIKPLIALLDDPNLDTRIRAAQAILSMTPQVVFSDSFENGSGKWRPYHSKPPQAKFSAVAGDAAHGQRFLRAQCPGQAGLEGVMASVSGVEPLSLYTFRAKVRGKGGLWGMMYSGNGWLYARRTLALTGQWQGFSMTKLTGARDRALSVYFVTKKVEPATFEIDAVEVVKEHDPPACAGRVEPVRLEAEDYAFSANAVKTDRTALGGKAVHAAIYTGIMNMPAPLSSTPTFCYVRLKPGTASDSYTLSARVADCHHTLATAKPLDRPGWQWLRFDAVALAASRGAVSVLVRQPKRGLQATALDSVVFASKGDLTPEQLAAAPLLRQDRPLLAVGQCQTPPVIDGRGDDPCWAECVTVRDFTLTCANVAPTQSTAARLCYDAERLYVTFQCHEYVLQPLANQLHAFQQGKTKRDDNLWSDDCVLAILGPTPQGPYFDVFCSARGTLDDARLALPDIWQSRDTRWNGDIEAAGRVGEGFWEVEMAVSFASLGTAAPKPGERWRLCLGRIEKNSKETSAWNPVTTGFHVADTLGTLVFRPQAGGVDALLPSSIRGGANRLELGLANATRPVLADVTAVQPKQTPTHFRTLAAAGDRAHLAFEVQAQGQLELRCDLFDAGTLAALYLSPRIKRSVRASEAKLRLATDAAYSVFLNGERVATGPKADGRGIVTVPLQAGVNAFSFQVQSGRVAASLELPGERVVSGPAWRSAPGEPAKFATATFNDSRWAKAQDFGAAAGALGKVGAHVVGGDKPGVIRRVVWFEKTYLWPTPEPAQHVPQNAPQHLTFSAPGMRGRVLERFKLHLAVPREFEVIGSTGYYGRKRDEKAEFVTSGPRTERRQGADVQVYTIQATKPIRYRPNVRILELFNVFVRYGGGKLPKGDFRFEFWTEAEDGSITECQQAFPVRVTPPLRGKQPKRLLTQLWGSFFSTMDDPPMRKATLETMRAVGFNNVVGVAPEAREFGITTTTGISFAVWCLDRRPYLEKHPDDALLDAEGKRSKIYVCPTALLSSGWDSVAAMLRERIARERPDIVDWDYESSPFTGYLSCYCPACLGEFRKHGGMKQDVGLTPQTICQTHAGRWIDFMTTRNAQLAQRFHKVVNECGPKFSMYSGYESEETHRVYGVDWRKIGKLRAADHVGCGYGRRKECVDATVAALETIPLVPGLLMRPYDRNLRERVVPVTKARAMRRLADSTGGILVYDRMPLAGRSWFALAEVFRLAADHEDVFLDGVAAPDLAEVEPGAEPEVAVKRSGKAALVLLMNHGQKAKTMTVRLKPDAVRTAVLYYAQKPVDPRQAFSVTLSAGDAEAIALTLR